VAVVLIAAVAVRVSRVAVQVLAVVVAVVAALARAAVAAVRAFERRARIPLTARAMMMKLASRMLNYEPIDVYIYYISDMNRTS
jgi:hypothetical protein